MCVCVCVCARGRDLPSLASQRVSESERGRVLSESERMSDVGHRVLGRVSSRSLVYLSSLATSLARG